MKNSAKQGCENMEIKMTTTDIPRMDANQYADYILNHYDRNSRMDTLCLARSLVENGYGRAEKAEAEVERLKVINADMRNFLAKAIHNEGFNEDQALKFIYQ